MDSLGAATVELLRIDARRLPEGSATSDRTSSPAPDETRGRRRLRQMGRFVCFVALLVLIQLLAAAADMSVVTLIGVYGGLVGLGVLPGLREPYSLRDQRRHTRR